MLVFSTAIVAVMQPIATRSPFGNLPQPLTSLSDKMLSWSGLGSSLLNLYHNLSFPTTLSNAVLAATYFSTISGLGISSSFLFDVPPVNDTITTNMTTRIGSPSLSGLISFNTNLTDIPPDFTTISFDWYRSGMSIGMLNAENTSVYPGLSANRVYDTLLSPLTASSNSFAMVGYTDISVKCGSVPQQSVSASLYSSTESEVEEPSGAPPLWVLLNATLLSINYTLGSSTMKLHDMISIPWRLNDNTLSLELWRPTVGMGSAHPKRACDPCVTNARRPLDSGMSSVWLNHT